MVVLALLAVGSLLSWQTHRRLTQQTVDRATTQFYVLANKVKDIPTNHFQTMMTECQALSRTISAQLGTNHNSTHHNRTFPFVTVQNWELYASQARHRSGSIEFITLNPWLYSPKDIQDFNTYANQHMETWQRQSIQQYRQLNRPPTKKTTNSFTTTTDPFSISDGTNHSHTPPPDHDDDNFVIRTNTLVHVTDPNQPWLQLPSTGESGEPALPVWMQSPPARALSSFTNPFATSSNDEGDGDETNGPPPPTNNKNNNTNTTRSPGTGPPAEAVAAAAAASSSWIMSDLYPFWKYSTQAVMATQGTDIYIVTEWEDPDPLWNTNFWNKRTHPNLSFVCVFVSLLLLLFVCLVLFLAWWFLRCTNTETVLGPMNVEIGRRMDFIVGDQAHTDFHTRLHGNKKQGNIKTSIQAHGTFYTPVASHWAPPPRAPQPQNDTTTKTEIGAILGGIFAYDVFLVNILPNGIRGITVVITDTCNASFTYELDGNEVRRNADANMNDME